MVIRLKSCDISYVKWFLVMRLKSCDISYGKVFNFFRYGRPTPAHFR